jgi:hypothetical protein
MKKFLQKTAIKIIPRYYNSLLELILLFLGVYDIASEGKIDIRSLGKLASKFYYHKKLAN